MPDDTRDMNLRLPALAAAILILSVSGVTAAARGVDDPTRPAGSAAMAAPPAEARGAAPASPTLAQGTAGDLPGSGRTNVIVPLALLALLASFLTSAAVRPAPPTAPSAARGQPRPRASKCPDHTRRR